MKKLIIFLFLSVVFNSQLKAFSGRICQYPLFDAVKQFEYFIKAIVLSKEIAIDSLGNNKVNLILLVKESFKKPIGDTIYFVVRYNNDEIYDIDGFKNVFMNIQTNGEYYFGLENENYLSPYSSYNKIEIINNYLNYRSFTKIDEFLRSRALFYKGRKMTVEKFEKKIRKKIKRNTV
jgi:hypothetical protein